MEYDFIDQGSGPALLFLPGSYSNFAAWKGVQKALKGSYRLISTSLPGYGGTAEIRSESNSGMEMTTNLVKQIVDRVGDPVHLVGHSYGGSVALAFALRHQSDLRSLITFEGNPIYSLKHGGDFNWWPEVDKAHTDFENAFAANDPDAAGVIIDFWSQPGAFKTMPEGFQQYCRNVVHSNILDWRTATGFRPHPEEFNSIGIPCTLARGEFTNQALIDLTDILCDQISGSTKKVALGAGHFLTATHPNECAAIIDNHMQAVLAR